MVGPFIAWQTGGSRSSWRKNQLKGRNPYHVGQTGHQMRSSPVHLMRNRASLLKRGNQPGTFINPRFWERWMRRVGRKPGIDYVSLMQTNGIFAPGARYPRCFGLGESRWK